MSAGGDILLQLEVKRSSLLVLEKNELKRQLQKSIEKMHEMENKIQETSLDIAAAQKEIQSLEQQNNALQKQLAEKQIYHMLQ